MGRKVHPIGFRLGINKTWEGRWYAEGKDYVNQLHQDFALRELVRNEAPRAGVSRVDIERFPGKVKVIVHTAKPGVLIGRKGETLRNTKNGRQEIIGRS
jgi:small subunit ribosomal protein S3